MRVFGDHAKIAITWQFGHSLSHFCAKILPSLCFLSAYYLEDDASFARALFGLLSEGIFLGDF